MRFSSAILTLTLCATTVMGTVTKTRQETNAERMRRGLPPRAPSRAFAPTRVARSVPSGFSCDMSYNQGVIQVVKSETVLGYIAYTNLVEASSPPVFSDGGIFQFDSLDTPNVGITYVSHSYRNWVARSDDGDLKPKTGPSAKPLEYGDILYKDKNGLLNYAYPGETFDWSDAGSYPKNMHTNTQYPNHTEPAEQHVFYIDSGNYNRITLTWVQGPTAPVQAPQVLEPFVCGGRLRWSTNPDQSYSDCTGTFKKNIELRFVCCSVYGGVCY
ncbi:hypothetical protein EXIGLDRAFT_341897 [Exidia glandulosa HHB12029]|uniref:Uncharacterized protein n=1 Tax=Exidia glandulosa HHB12029 TaxID=1314781 RepID=A0A165LGJ4_EXIGL|nr:hypothetical protein EXIGLDRAFT_341897 [Exidia glandulosa HHB12029]